MKKEDENIRTGGGGVDEEAVAVADINSPPEAICSVSLASRLLLSNRGGYTRRLYALIAALDELGSNPKCMYFENDFFIFRFLLALPLALSLPSLLLPSSPFCSSHISSLTHKFS